MNTDVVPARMQRPMHKIFINDFGRLRSGWRLLVFVAGFVFLTMIWGIVVRLLHEVVPAFPHREPALEIVFRGGVLLIALGVGYLLVRQFEDLPWRSLGLTLHQGWLRDLLIGSA